MKAALLVLLLLTGCAAPCADCLTLTKDSMVKALSEAWTKGYTQGFDDGEDHIGPSCMRTL